MHDVLDARDLLSDELAQRRRSGYDVEGLEERINSALADYPEEELWRLLDLLEDAPRLPQWPYDEPSCKRGASLWCMWMCSYEHG